MKGAELVVNLASTALQHVSSNQNSATDSASCREIMTHRSSTTNQSLFTRPIETTTSCSLCDWCGDRTQPSIVSPLQACLLVERALFETEYYDEVPRDMEMHGDRPVAGPMHLRVFSHNNNTTATTQEPRLCTDTPTEDRASSTHVQFVWKR